MVVAAITSNLRLAAAPGNVGLSAGKAAFRAPSVVHVSQIRTIDRTRLGERIGVLRPASLRLVLQGLALQLGTDELDTPEGLA